MSFFKRFFKKGNHTDSNQPKIQFGRYSDIYKSKEQFDAWDTALEQFEDEKYLDSFRYFLAYLSDEENDNIIVDDNGDNINFEIYQGSKTVRGEANRQSIKAEAKVALTKKLNIGFLRRMVEQNYMLQYCRFALDDDNNITLVFDTFTPDGSPYKMYYGLKEMAVNADKHDDLLIEEFDSLSPVNAQHIEGLPDAEKEVKYEFILDEVKTTLDVIDNGRLDANKYPGAVAYLVLGLCYKLDYLVAPQGFMTDALERIHRQYFEGGNNSVAQKNLRAKKGLKKLLERDKEEYFKEMYRITSTFGITASAGHEQIVQFINGELPNMDWYKDNNYTEVALSITNHIVGFCLFNYALPHPDKDLFHLYFHIVENEYFKQLGYPQSYYDVAKDKLDKSAITEAIESIARKHEELYPTLNPETKLLTFTTLTDFTKSYLLMIRAMQVIRVEE